MDEFFEKHPVPGDMAKELHVILDEILSNIIRHGYDDGDPHEIGIALARAGNEVTLEVDDDGRPFDPTGAPAPAPQGKIARSEAGGLGLVFVRAFSDSVRYQRSGPRNRLTICRRVPDAPHEAVERPAFALAETQEGRTRVVEIEGRLDSTNAWMLKDRLLAMIEEGARELVVDISRVGYVGSAGFWALLLTDRLLEARGGALALCGLNEEFARALDRGGLASVLRLCASRAEAVKAAQAAK